MAPYSAWMWRISRLTRHGTGRPNLSPEAKLSGVITNGDREKRFFFPLISWPRRTGLATLLPRWSKLCYLKYDSTEQLCTWINIKSQIISRRKVTKYFIKTQDRSEKLLQGVCVCVCVCIYWIAHNRAIRPCHPSHSMPLALILPRVDQWYLLRKPLIRRDKGDTLSLLVQLLLKPWVPCAAPPASLLLSRWSGLAATGPTLSFLHIFLVPPKSPPFPTWPLQIFCGFLRFFASLPPSPILSSFRSRYPPRSVPIILR